MKMYSIGEVAEKLGVTSSFLKYYQHHNLLNPHVSENGYRSYQANKLSPIYEYVKLKNMGFSAKEIGKMHTDEHYTQILDRLKIKKHELEQQIRFLQLSVRHIDRMCAEYPTFETDACWNIGMHGNFYFLPQSSNFTFYEDSNITNLAAIWKEWLPAVQITARADYRDNIPVNIQWGLSIHKHILDFLELPLTDAAEFVPASRYLEYLDRRELKEDCFHDSPEEIRDTMFVHVKDILNQYQFSVTGPSYFFVRAKIREDGVRCTYQKILTPIE